MKLVQFYLLISTIFITIIRNSLVIGTGYLSAEELGYLSKRLYPAECSYLTKALSKSLQNSCNVESVNNNSDDVSMPRPEIHCLIKLEEWNEMSLKDDKAHERINKILHEIGRFDLAAYLLKKTI